jgi:hypothetical protein
MYEGPLKENKGIWTIIAPPNSQNSIAHSTVNGLVV